MDPHAASYPSWSPYTYVFNNPLIFIDPDGRDGIRVVDKENKTVTIKANIYMVTQGMTLQSSKRGRKTKSFSSKDVARFQKKLNKKLTKWAEKNGPISSGDLEGYSVNFDVNVIDGGDAASAKSLADNDKIDGHSVGNTIALGGETNPLFAKVENEDGETTSQVDGVTSKDKYITMDPSGSSTMSKIHEVFHTLGMNHPKGRGSKKGIMAYPPQRVNQNDTDFLGNGSNGFLPKVKKD